MNNISFEIKIIAFEDNKGNYKQYKGKQSMIINDIEYNFIKKSLKREYGIDSEFDKLNEEVKNLK